MTVWEFLGWGLSVGVVGIVLTVVGFFAASAVRQFKDQNKR